MYNDFFDDYGYDDGEDNYYLFDDPFDCPCGCGGFFMDDEDDLIESSYEDYLDDYFEDYDEDDYYDFEEGDEYGTYILTL